MTTTAPSVARTSAQTPSRTIADEYPLRRLAPLCEARKCATACGRGYRRCRFGTPRNYAARADIFISYSTRDSDVALRVPLCTRGSGVACWIRSARHCSGRPTGRPPFHRRSMGAGSWLRSSRRMPMRRTRFAARSILLAASDVRSSRFGSRTLFRRARCGISSPESTGWMPRQKPAPTKRSANSSRRVQARLADPQARAGYG